MKGKKYFIISIVLFLIATLIFIVFFQTPIQDKKKPVTTLSEKYFIDPSYVNEISNSPKLRKANDDIRKYELGLLGEAITIYISEKGELGEEVTETPQHISKEGADICPLLVPDYIGCLPRDLRMRMKPNEPFNAKGFACECDDNYTTGIFISKNSEGRIVLESPLAEDSEMIQVIP